MFFILLLLHCSHSCTLQSAPAVLKDFINSLTPHFIHSASHSQILPFNLTSPSLQPMGGCSSVSLCHSEYFDFKTPFQLIFMFMTKKRQDNTDVNAVSISVGYLFTQEHKTQKYFLLPCWVYMTMSLLIADTVQQNAHFRIQRIE